MTNRHRPGFTVRPAAVAVIIVVLALFITGLVVRGVAGGLLVGIPTLAAGVLLVLRWQAIDPRIRIMRAVVVGICLVIAVTLVVRG